MATQLFLQGRSYYGIVAELNASPYKPRNGGKWTYSTVYGMMHNDIYAGLIHYGEIKTTQPSEEFPALWDEKTHTQIVAERGRRRQGGKRPASMASSIVICAKCQKSMGISRRGKYVYFRCATQARKWRTGVECHTNNIREDIVIEALEEMCYTIRVLEPIDLDAMLVDSINEREHLLSERDRLHNSIEKAKQGLDRLAHFVAEGALDISAASAKNQELVVTIKEKTKRLNDIERELLSLPSADEQRERLQAVLDLSGLADMDRDVVRRTLIESGIRVFVESGRIVRIGF